MRKIRTIKPAKAQLSETLFFNYGIEKPDSSMPMKVGLENGRTVPGLIIQIGPIERCEVTGQPGRQVRVVYRLH